MLHLRLKLISTAIVALVGVISVFGTGNNVPAPWSYDTGLVVDTIPLMDNYDNSIYDSYENPFDIKPTNIVQTAEYDPVSGNYIIYEKIGEEYFRTPTVMTFEEYVEWQNKEQEKLYFQQLAGINTEYKSSSGIVDPISKIDIQDNLVDRLFGGTGVDLQPQGNIDLTFGGDYQKIQNPNIPLRNQTNGGFDFDMDIKMNVDGTIGKKMKLGFNYDTQATFDFDRKIKLEYDTEAFSEDDIIKKLEAGNVSLPLRSTLIQGAQSLFGLKTELQFGKLRLTAIASQQKSQNESLNIQNGSSVQEFEIRPDEYDENRHFFLSHYHRDTYENTLSNLPYLNTPFRVNNIQVWVSDDRADYQQNSTQICFITDLAEPNEENFSNPNPMYEVQSPFPAVYEGANDNPLPDNNVNGLYELITDDENVRRKDMTSTILKGGEFGLTQTRDFEVQRGRLLSRSEYSFSPELGFISLNVRLKPNQVLGVSYEYFYVENCDTLYSVGELSQDAIFSDTNEEGEVEPASVLFVKMLKSSTQPVSDPNWDLMMKNVYPLRTNSLDQTDFEFDIFYEDDQNGTVIKFLPIEEARTTPLLNLFGLDKLNSFGDPQPDGIFDFVPGVTVIPSSGSMVFPVLEPFGSSIDSLLSPLGVNQAVIDSFKFNELYDTTVVIARQMLESSKFIMKGRVKSSSSSEISLGAWNIPNGSVRVTAGGDVLTEGVDYEIDYGIGRIRIINQAYLQSGVPIRVSYEDNSVFSLQQKTMLGLRADYEVNEKLALGATYLRLFERPFTEKVNVGDDPINNRIFGADLTYSTESEGITRLVDKLPLYSTNEPSTFNFNAEVAALRPGHSSAINLSDQEGGVVSIDDFEGAVSGFPLGSQVNRWFLASTPADRPEGELVDNLAYGANRALLNWYTIDRTGRNTGDNDDPYSRLIRQNEIFQRDIPAGQLPDLFTFDLSYYPDQRGPYNFDLVGGRQDLVGMQVSAGVDPTSQNDVRLLEPETRWGGIMRYFNNADFQAANYEIIEFWLLNPFMEDGGDMIRGKDHLPDEAGKIVFHLGNVSEDILNDNQQFYENTIPVDGDAGPSIDTEWGTVPLNNPTNNAFDLNNREEQDLGLDGLNDADERARYDEWIMELQGAGIQDQDIINDPANDNFVYFLNENVYPENTPLFERYEKFNGPQGNAPDGSQNERGNPFPDSEDLNNNFSLDEGENYYKYEVDLINNNGQLTTEGQRYIKAETTGANGEQWYQFQIPINEVGPDNTVGEIQGFRSIQFIRMLVEGFATAKTLRLAEFRLVRNQWRRSDPVCRGIDGGIPPELEFSVTDVGKEEDSSREPFGYVLPKGILQEQLFGTFSQVLQDEKSLSLNFEGLTDSCEVAMNKLTELDARLFKRLQMFVHAEDKVGQPINDGDLSLFIRVGKDFVNHYYEYEIPLVMSRDGVPSNDDSEIVWRAENYLDFPLSLFTELKKQRNVEGREFTEEFGRNYNDLITLVGEEVDPNKDSHLLNIIGNPNLGQIKGIQIGVKVTKGVEGPQQGFCGSVWVNELRANGLEERGGLAGLARMDIQLADLGSLSASGGYSSVGWGALDQKLADRSLDEFIDYDLAANFELGKFVPSSWGLSVPFYAQYSKSIRNPKYDPYDLDLDVREKLEIAKTDGERDTINQRAQEVSTIRTVNFTNVRKTRQGKKGSAKPWDVENLSASYAFTEVDRRDPILKEDNSKDYRVGFNYNYAAKGYSIQPFKKLVKSKYLKFIQELNFNPIPSSFSFGSEVRRFKSQRTFREPDIPVFQFNDRRFDWTRNYDLRWDLTKALKLSFTASNQSVIDEYRQVGIAADPADRDWVNERGDNVTEVVNNGGSDAVSEYWRDNLRKGGRVKDYNHNLGLTYNVPFKNFPGLDWISAKAQYRADYAWTAGALIAIDTEGNGPGNVIQNNQDRSVTAGFNLEKLYEKIGYLKRLEGKSSKKSRRKRSVRDNKKDLSSADGKKTERVDRKKEEGDGKASFIEKLFLRPVLSLRKVDFTYREDYSTVIPGFLGEPELLGLSGGFDSPGWDFVGGIQPDISLDNDGRDNWLFRAADQDWLNRSSAFNQQILQNQSKNYEAKVKVEPWKDVKIDVNFKKNYSTNHSENFRFKEQQFGDFRQLALNDVGSFEYSYFSLPTLFNDSDDGLKELFATFEDNRKIISARLPNEVGAGIHSVDGQDYTQGYGALSSDVLVPAFLAAYTGGDANSVLLDVETEVAKASFIPKPNWKLNYNGLSKLDMFKDIFSSFSIEHGYSNTLRVSRFNTDPQYNADNQFAGLKENGNYFSRIEIPEVLINERFDPIIGIKMKTKNDANLGIAYRKSRTLALSTIAKTVDEQRNTELSFELGYTFRNVNIGFLTKDSGKNKRKNRDDKDKDDEKDKDKDDSQVDKNRRNNRRGVINTRGRDLVFNVDFAFSDNVSFVHRIDQGKSAEPTRGLESLRISPSVDYEVNENFTLRMFVEYSKTKPRLSTSFPITSVLGGLTMRFNLN